MDDNTTRAEGVGQPTIPAEGRTFRGTVTRVQKSLWTTKDNRPIYHVEISDEKSSTSFGAEIAMRLESPVLFGADYDIIVKPAS